MNDESGVAPDWYLRAFDALYPVVYAHRTIEAAAPEAAFAAEVLRLTPNDGLLDLACGNGRHLAHLRGRVAVAVGLDYSVELLALARANLGPAARLVRADMRAVPFSGAFDVVTNFFTSFGYFFSEAENRRTVRSVAQALKPGGRFFIDYLNPSNVEATLVPRSHRQLGAYEVDEARWIDRARRRVNKTTTVYKDGVHVENLEESVQLYTLDELKALLAAGGLRVDTVFGDFSGAAYSDARPRMIMAGHKS